MHSLPLRRALDCLESIAYRRKISCLHQHTNCNMYKTCKVDTWLFMAAFSRWKPHM